MPSKIEWCEETWNPITGCTKVSEGCKNCYAERMAKRLAGRFGYPKDDPFRVTFHPDKLDQPRRWKKPRRIFVCSMGDLFHEDVEEKWIDAVFGEMGIDPQHTFMVLTKRAARMADYINRAGRVLNPWPWSNVHLGVTVENQARADERIPILLQIPAAYRFVSYEPALGPVDFHMGDNLPMLPEGVPEDSSPGCIPCDVGGVPHGHRITSRGPCARGLDYIIAGGESGPSARPSHPDWFRSVRDECAAAGAGFFFKQWGAWAPCHNYAMDWYLTEEGKAGEPIEADRCYQNKCPLARVGKKRAGRFLDGREHNEMEGSK